MECPSCKEQFNLTQKVPKNLPCGHTLCLECLNALGKDGQFSCPIDTTSFVFNLDSDFPNAFAILDRLRELYLKCSQHPSLEAANFCKSHLLPLCENCHCYSDQACRLIPVSEVREIRFELCKALEQCDKSKIPPNLRHRYNTFLNMSLEELVSLLHAIRNAENTLFCIACDAPAFQWVNMSRMSVYCQGCFEALQSKSSAADEFFPFVLDNSEEIISQAWSSMTCHLQAIDFFALTQKHYQFLSAPPRDLPSFMRAAKEILDLKLACTNSLNGLPESFLCPMCGATLSRMRFTIRKLPCAQAFHGICSDCAKRHEGYEVVVCPLDSQTYSTQIYSLPELSEPQRIFGKDMYLMDKGILIPPFEPAASLSSVIPCQYLTAADRFSRVLPAEEPLKELRKEDQGFVQPWFIDRYMNQVEVLTIQSFGCAALWGVGIANPISPSMHCEISSARIYKGNQANGEYKEVYLLNRHLKRSQGVITDIYFAEPYLINMLEAVTVKMKLVPTLDSQERVALFHGNHIGKREDLIGLDGMAWECVETIGVEEGENNSGQQHFIGPILRLIYQNLR